MTTNSIYAQQDNDTLCLTPSEQNDIAELILDHQNLKDDSKYIRKALSVANNIILKLEDKSNKQEDLINILTDVNKGNEVYLLDIKNKYDETIDNLLELNELYIKQIHNYEELIRQKRNDKWKDRLVYFAGGVLVGVVIN